MLKIYDIDDNNCNEFDTKIIADVFKCDIDKVEQIKIKHLGK